MTSAQAEQLVKMANQIAANMSAWGTEEEVAEKIAEHLARFWTPVMCEQLRESLSSPEQKAVPLVVKALAILPGHPA